MKNMIFSCISGISRVAKDNRGNKNNNTREYLVIDTCNYNIYSLFLVK